MFDRIASSERVIEKVTDAGIAVAPGLFDPLEGLLRIATERRVILQLRWAR
jgi:hypothetical protein